MESNCPSSFVDTSKFKKPGIMLGTQRPVGKDYLGLIKKYVFSRFMAYALVWLLILKVALDNGLAQIYVCVSGIALILFNLGKRKMGELSAYSVFNEGGKRLPGTMDSRQIDPRYVPSGEGNE